MIIIHPSPRAQGEQRHLGLRLKVSHGDETFRGGELQDVRQERRKCAREMHCRGVCDDFERMLRH